MATKVTAAKLIKQIMLEHQGLVEADGTTAVPVGIPFDIQTEGTDIYGELRSKVLPIYSAVLSHVPSLTAVLSLKANDPRNYKNAVKQFFVARVLRYLSRSSVALGKSLAFTTRTFLTHDLVDMDIGTDLRALLEDSNAIFQIKRISNDTDPYMFTWTVIVDGAVITRGDNQPFHKLITGLLKSMNQESIMNLHEIQVVVQELANMRPSEKLYYWYLSNQNTAQHYRLFADERGASSCMAKQASYYDKTGSRQHPMDAYNGSPDWRLMFISEHSPEEITVMCDNVIENPDAADRLFDYPFLTRSMVLPSAKEESSTTYNTPYVFGKMYGLEKILRYLFEDSQGVHHLNNNPLMTHDYHVAGGRVTAAKSTRDGYGEYYVLPYFDQANMAKLRMDADGTEWFVSTYLKHEKSLTTDRSPLIWKGQYQSGAAQAVRAYSQASGEFFAIEDYVPEMFTTIIGEEHSSMRSRYKDVRLNGASVSVPESWTMRHAGARYLTGQMVMTSAGDFIPLEKVTTQPERYKCIPNVGYYDLNNPRDNHAFAALTAIMPAEVPEAIETVSSVLGADATGTTLNQSHDDAIDAVRRNAFDSIVAS